MVAIKHKALLTVLHGEVTNKGKHIVDYIAESELFFHHLLKRQRFSY